MKEITLEKVREKVAEYRDEIARDISELIRIPSVRGGEDESCIYNEQCQAAMDWYTERAKQMGFEPVLLDGKVGYIEYGGTGRIAGSGQNDENKREHGNEDGQDIVAIAVHLDVVPEGDGWTHAPYGGELEDGKIYGRGATDNKGPAVGALYTLKALKDLGASGKNRIRVIYGAKEETSEFQDMYHYIEKEGLPKYGLAPDAGQYSFNGEKSRLMYYHHFGEGTAQGETGNVPTDIVISIKGGTAGNVVPDKAAAIVAVGDHPAGISEKGVAAHAKDPAQGVNAIGKLVDSLCEFFGDEIQGPVRFLHDYYGMETDGSGLGLKYADENGELTVNLGTVDVMDGCGSAEINMRFPPGKPMEEVKSQIEKIGRENGVGTEFFFEAEGFSVDPNSEFYQCVQRSYESVTGKALIPQMASIGTYSRAFQGRMFCYGCTLPEEDFPRYHQFDEFLDLDYFMTHMAIQVVTAVNLMDL